MSQSDNMARYRAFVAGEYTPAVKIKPEDSYNNYNLNNFYFNSNHKSLKESNNLEENNYKNYNGLRQKIHSDKWFLMAQSWGVTPQMLYACVRDYGEAKVKAIIFKLSPERLAAGYFRQGEPIELQRGRLFSVEMRRLKNKR